MTSINTRPIRLQKRIVFCSRLNKRKGLEQFISLAEAYQSSNLKFEVYGPDGGELNLLLSQIEKRKISHTLKYQGSLPSEEVQLMLQEVDLLILPSKDEPYPMIILEALSVGTQVLIMPSCGLAKKLKEFESAFVADTDDLSGLLNSFKNIVKLNFEIRTTEEIRAFCRDGFSISDVTDQLLDCYRRACANA